MKPLTNLSAFLEFVYKQKYDLTASEKMIVQRQRNELKYNFLDVLIETLTENGIDKDLIHRTTDGYIFEMQNKELGFIPVQIDIKIKDVDYDLEGAIIEWEDKVAEKEAKELARQKAELEKQRKREEKQNLRALRNAKL